MLMDFLTAEYEKGNYVIAGGDFNQTFPGALDAFPIQDPALWTPGVLEQDILPEGWQFACDLTGEGTGQGHALRPVHMKPAEGLQAAVHLEYTDHNPVSLRATLLDQ